MRYIDQANWPRRQHFEIFGSLDYPHVNMCVNVDLTAFYREVKRLGISFNIATVYVIARAANAVPELRQRIRTGEVVEHDVVHPSTTIMSRDNLFSFCAIMYAEEFSLFAARAAECVAMAQAGPSLDDEPGRDDLLFLTAIPWVSFTSFVHPLHWHPVDSIPRFAWGKFFREGQAVKMPLSMQAHHGLVDGLHFGHFFERAQALFDDPAGTLTVV
ncbi:MAG: chloramphenicol acetyltransferase [Chloroflexota bacterium]|jgi:chloramphenicol O-acetyltransferase type A